ncbi:2-(3-amino-3-carboxypropyl)histidine synthase [Nematocida minor]|uniref:2-(3-amino-3-carboxypropyl)histidine synthase n=1 Tax=Nematocida minor TaxID=1912983 RepID=UPI00221F3E96|nr:2-(3-amino-3-carboxypropyl)histidine synthase [Nematocida minor]KAI5189241.1 2-(3-amino-3-carboxypropyl)histidine synthase [Nematocida minor]
MNIIGSEYLPDNYKFELQKTIRQIERRKSKRVAIQFPEGIIHLSTIISDIIRSNTNVESVFILSDVVYGACCIDDVSAHLIDCDLLIHYGHSCLFEVTKSLIQVMYIFVEIQFDIAHCMKLVNKHINTDDLSILGTIQYNSTIRKIKKEIEREKILKIADSKSAGETEESSSVCTIPRVQPLSPGEVLGCTSPKVSTGAVLFISEGRFHLESLMIQNPGKVFYKYCPSSKAMTVETHNYDRFLEIRREIKKKSLDTPRYLIVFGTLGRQGSTGILEKIVEDLKKRKKSYYVVYLSEIDEVFVEALKDITVIEIACPRIAIDWGSTFSIPIITPFEYFSRELKEYPMDYYAKETEEMKPWQSLQ